VCAAFADRDYTIRFTANAQGDITGTGNTLLTCDDRDVRCAAARRGQGGTANNNNGIAMRYVDVDSDAATFDSSAATLNLPAGAHVLFAGLYYGGRLRAGIGGHGAPSSALRDRVLLRPPNLGAYVPLRAARVDDAPVRAAHTYRLYQGFVDVTDIVRTAGAGEYTVGNVQLGTGLDADQSGGWALSVAYEDATQPTRNLTIFDGFHYVVPDGPAVDIPLSGFVTPRTGTVSTRIGLVAIEGDLGTTGDSATINAGLPTARVLQNASNPANNFFNASISARDGTPFTLRRPNDVNQFGYDADVVDANRIPRQRPERDDDPPGDERRRLRAAGRELRDRPVRPQPPGRQGGRPRHRPPGRRPDVHRRRLERRPRRGDERDATRRDPGRDRVRAGQPRHRRDDADRPRR